MKSSCLVLSVFALCLVAGCGESVDPRISSLRQKLMLTSIPGEPTPVGEIRKALKAEDAAESMDVVVYGSTYIGESSPWEGGKAAFVATDATGHEGEKVHDPHSCPFCKTHIEDYFMFISFPDDRGLTIDVDSRELFQLKEKQLVYVKGTASLNEADEVIIQGTGLFTEK